MKRESALLLLTACLVLAAPQARATEVARLSANGSCPGAVKAEPETEERSERAGKAAPAVPATTAGAGSAEAGAPARGRMRWQSFLPGMFK